MGIELNKIYNGDCLEVLKTFPDNCIDTIITDPPYELGFMGKSWDRTGVTFKEKTWQEILRVAKPGATLLCFGGTRTFHRLACAIEDAGWIIKDTIAWIYGSGFPKATDISKWLDKRAGQEIENKSEFTEFSAQTDTTKHIKRYKKCKECGKLLFSQDPCKCKWRNPKGQTLEAKFWNGWKSHGLKPAYEPIIMAMKPNEGCYAENALKWGVAGLNIDEGRINYTDGRNKYKFKRHKKAEANVAFKMQKEGQEWSAEKGRFPANLILDEEAAKILDEHSGNRHSSGEYKQGGNVEWWGTKSDYKHTMFNDKGGASRFFYVAKASKFEKNNGLEDFEVKHYEKRKDPQKVIWCKKCNHYIDPNRKVKGNCCCDEPEPYYREEQFKASTNLHPTVKPLKLMEYLCKLTKTPTGGIVLDPFAGSGTTGMACKKTGRDYVLIEKEEEYCKIAEARIKAIPEPLSLF